MIITKTPYRISFFGGGSDYEEWFKINENYGEVISTTIDKNIYIKTLKSGEDCLEYLKINNTDIIFMDEYMTPGELLGSETVSMIRKLNYNVKIIHYSTNSSIEDTKKYLNAGSDLVLKKPYPIKTIDNIIYNLMNNK